MHCVVMKARPREVQARATQMVAVSKARAARHVL